jgi:ATP-binding cassette subfamily C protein CydD
LLLFTAPLIPLFMVLVGMGAESISQKHYEALSRLGARFLDILRGIETLKRFGRSRGRSESISRSSEQYRRRTMGVLRVAFLSSAVLEFFSSIAIALVAVYLGLTYLGYLNFGLYGRALSLEKGLFILLLAPEFYLPLRELGTSYHARAEAIGAVGEIRQLLDASSPAGGAGTGAPVLSPAGIRFEGVFFAYEGAHSSVLSGIDLALTPGRRTFLVGGSGEGKTTLLYLLMKFVVPTSGRILVDGRSLSKISPEAWREQISWVGQEPRLVAGTVRENIRLGCPEATEAAVKAAAQIAHVEEFASRMPNGLDQDAGEGGRLLSRGQAQRVALARAILADAPVLLLDEPLAGLDAETERKVAATLERLCREKTVLWVTHRLHAVGPDDRLLVLSGGRVREVPIEELRPGSAGR